MTVCPTCGRPMAEPVAAGRNTMTGSTQSPWGHVLGNVPRLPDFSNDINAKTEERGGIGGILRNAGRLDKGDFPAATSAGSVVSPMTSSVSANPMDAWMNRQQNNAGVGGNSLWDMWRNRIGR